MLSETVPSPLLILGLLAAFVCSCSSNPLSSNDASREAGAVDGERPRDSTDRLTFAANVYPIMQAAGCAECHTTERRLTSHWAFTTPSETFAQWVNARGFNHCDANGDPIEAPRPDQIRVIPGDPENSLVIRKLTAPWEMCGPFYGHMPPSPRPRLSSDDVELVRAWVVAGAPP